MTLKKYFALARITLIERFSHFWNKLATAFILALILFVFLQIWKAVYAGKADIDGYTIAQMIWYLTLTEVILFSTGSHKIDVIGEEIRSGAIANALLKPFNYVGREFSVLMAEFVYSFTIIGTVGVILAYILVGTISVTFVGLFLTALLILGAAMISFLIVLSLALLALWLEDTSSIMWIYQKLLFIVGGMLVPLDFYPHWLQQAVQYLPTAYIMYLPARLFVHFSYADFMSALIGQVVWILVLTITVLFIYHRGIRKVHFHGG